MTYAERVETGRRLCWKLMERIGEFISAIPADYWPPIVGAPSVAFMDALFAWEKNPSDASMRAVSQAYDALIEAWRVAAIEYTTEGAT